MTQTLASITILQWVLFAIVAQIFFRSCDGVPRSPQDVKGLDKHVSADKRFSRLPKLGTGKGLNPGYYKDLKPRRILSNVDIDARNIKLRLPLLSRVFNGDGMYAFNPYLRYIEEAEKLFGTGTQEEDHVHPLLENEMALFPIKFNQKQRSSAYQRGWRHYKDEQVRREGSEKRRKDVVVKPC